MNFKGTIGACKRAKIRSKDEEGPPFVFSSCDRFSYLPFHVLECSLHKNLLARRGEARERRSKVRLVFASPKEDFLQSIHNKIFVFYLYTCSNAFSLPFRRRFAKFEFVDIRGHKNELTRMRFHEILFLFAPKLQKRHSTTV